MYWVLKAEIYTLQVYPIKNHKTNCEKIRISLFKLKFIKRSMPLSYVFLGYWIRSFCLVRLVLFSMQFLNFFNYCMLYYISNLFL